MERVGLMGSLFNSTKEITVAVFFHGKSCDIIQSSIKIGAYPDLCFLAIILIFVIIKICYAYLKELKPFGSKCI